jgi:hypothetical protein
MGESAVMPHQQVAQEEELLVERIKIFNSEQTGGGSESEGDSSGEGEGEGQGEGDEVIWQG